MVKPLLYSSDKLLKRKTYSFEKIFKESSTVTLCLFLKNF